MSAAFMLGQTLLAFAATVAGVAVFRRWAQSRRLLDVPNARSSHQVPTPRGAGLVIVAVSAAALIADSWSGRVAVTSYGVVAAIGALFIAGISLIDDFRSLGSLTRLAAHSAAAIVVVSAWGGAGEWEWVARVTAVVWIVGLTNAYNFMDGVDGIAGGQALVTAITLAIVAWHVGAFGAVAVGTALIGSSAGFLLFNWSPARVFMGDVGSAYLGFLFAAVALGLMDRSPAAAAAVVLSLWPFLFDTSITLVRRALKGENVLASHRTHLYQRIVIAGATHGTVALGYMTMSALAAAAAMVWVIHHGGTALVVAVPGALAVLLWLVTGRLESRRMSPSRAAQK